MMSTINSRSWTIRTRNSPNWVPSWSDHSESRQVADSGRCYNSTMPRQSTVYEVLIASPSDVVKERAVIAQVLEDWNSANSRSQNLSLQALRWELDAVPSTGEP